MQGLKKERSISDFLPKDRKNQPKDFVNPLGLTWQALGIPADRTERTSITATQLEISRALRTAYNAAQVRNMTNTFDRWYLELSTISASRTSSEALANQLVEKGKSALSVLEQGQIDNLQKLVAQNSSELRRLGTLRESLPSSSAQRLRDLEQQEQELDNLIQRAIGALPPSDRNAYLQNGRKMNSAEARSETISQESRRLTEYLVGTFGISMETLSADNRPVNIEKPSDHLMRIKHVMLDLFPPGAT